jgi:hypothetical protein
MANSHDAFQRFNEFIALTAAKTNSLRTSRDALRKTIRDYFKDNDLPRLKFCWQGSFAMKTIVNPIDDDYDIDDGIYLQGYENIAKDEWVSVDTVHNWVLNAADDRTKEDSTDKHTCIRVYYSAGYHIDLPVYIVSSSIAYLAHKGKGWLQSDPKAFRDWFIDKLTIYGEQLRRVVRYLKAWKEFKGVELKGVEITILVSQNFSPYANRDDKAMRDTLTSIINTLQLYYSCSKPVFPYEDLFDGHSKTKKESIIIKLTSLRDSLSSAIDVSEIGIATEKLNACFGSRFPIILNKSNEDANNSNLYQRTSAPGVLGSDGRSG